MIRPEPKGVNSTDEVLLFSTNGYLDESSQTWRLPIRGAVYDPQEVKLQKRILLRVLSKIMRIDQTRLNSPIFKDRIEAFVGTTQKGKRIDIQLLGQQHRLQKKTKRNGQFAGSITLNNDEVQINGTSTDFANNWLEFQVALGNADSREIIGRVQLLSGTGLSVISDIDDTIKFTNVTSRKELVANTFFRDFSAIEGMADVYRNWAELGAAFHYVSSSPWQLSRPLSHLLSECRFPSGSMHLREFRLRDQMLRRVMLVRRKGKAVAMEKLLKQFPNRKFILVGDSGEKDPEIYLKLAKRYPDAVQGIFIRSLQSRPLVEARLQRLLEKIGDDKFHSFSDSDELLEKARDLVASPVMA